MMRLSITINQAVWFRKHGIAMAGRQAKQSGWFEVGEGGSRVSGASSGFELNLVQNQAAINETVRVSLMDY